MCISLSVLVPVTLISPIRASHIFYFYGEKSPTSVVKVPAAILNPELDSFLPRIKKESTATVRMFSRGNDFYNRSCFDFYRLFLRDMSSFWPKLIGFLSL